MQSTIPSRQIRFLTTNYQRLQGLRLVPSGASTFLAGALLLAWPTTIPYQSLMWLILPMAAVGIIARRWIESYYARTFGSIQPAKPLPTGEQWLLGIQGGSLSLRFALATGIVVLTVLLEVKVRVPAYVILGVWLIPWSAGVVLYLFRSHTLSTRFYWAIGAVLLAVFGLLSVLPLGALSSLHQEHEITRFLGLIALPWGLMLLMCSLLDHRLLYRSFASSSTGSHATTL